MQDTADLQYFIKDGHHLFAGRHVIVDLWSGTGFDKLDYVEAGLTDAAHAAEATILEKKFHVFSPNNGVTGVLILAESHISIHTWPEADFAAIDIFMCGECDPALAIPVLETHFAPRDLSVQTFKRGLTQARRP